MGEFKHVHMAWIGVQDSASGGVSREEERLVTNGQLDDYRVIVGVGEICVFGGPKDF